MTSPEDFAVHGSPNMVCRAGCPERDLRSVMQVRAFRVPPGVPCRPALMYACPVAVGPVLPCPCSGATECGKTGCTPGYRFLGALVPLADDRRGVSGFLGRDKAIWPDRTRAGRSSRRPPIALRRIPDQVSWSARAGPAKVDRPSLPAPGTVRIAEQRKTWRPDGSARNRYAAMNCRIPPETGGIPVDCTGSAAVCQVPRQAELSGAFVAIKVVEAGLCRCGIEGSGPSCPGAVNGHGVSRTRHTGHPVPAARRHGAIGPGHARCSTGAHWRVEPMA